MDSDYFFIDLFYNIQVSPPTIGSILALVLSFILLIISGIVSSSESAFFSLTPSDKNEIHERNNSSDNLIIALLNRSEHLLATILILSNFINVTVVILSTYAFNNIFDFSYAPFWGFVFEVILLSFFLLLSGEIIPKIYAQNAPLKFARKIVYFINILDRLCYPLSKILVKSTSIANKIFNKKTSHDISVDELSKALELTSSEIKDDKDILEGIINLYNKTAVEIMTSRLDVVCIDIKSDFKEVISYVIDVGYSRIPVYAANQDDIKGILYIKDLLPHLDKEKDFHWQSLIRSAFFVPETKKIDDLLEEFRSNKIHLAIVIDEFGGTSGIVTLEDILEEIVGEINDEYDDDDSKFIQLADGSFIFEAKTLLPDFFKITGLDPRDFEKVTGEVDTLAGLILEIKGDFPERKELIEYNRYTFQVLEINKRRILKVKFFMESLIQKDAINSQ